MSQGMPDLGKLPFGRFLNFVRWWCTRNMEDQKDVAAFETRLWRPPPGRVATKGPWSPASESAAFQSLKSALGK